MPIGYLERRRRLNANRGYLRRKIRHAGRAALMNLITCADDPTVSPGNGKPSHATVVLDHLRFWYLLQVDRDGDVVDRKTKEKYYREHGFSEPKEQPEQTEE